jgi:hypothetical protein
MTISGRMTLQNDISTSNHGENTHEIVENYAIKAFLKKILNFLKHIGVESVYICEHYVAPFMLCLQKHKYYI